MDIRKQVVEEISRLNKILALLDGGSVSSPGFASSSNGRKKRKRKKMSAAARAKISAAQKARWARAKKKE